MPHASQISLAQAPSRSFPPTKQKGMLKGLFDPEWACRFTFRRLPIGAEMHQKLAIPPVGPFLAAYWTFACLCVAFAQSPKPASAPVSAPLNPAGPGMIVPLWPDGKMPGHGANKPESRNVPAAPGAFLLINDVSQPTMEVFKARTTPGAAPAMIVCPGGGYSHLAYNREGTEIAAWLNSLGITAIVLKYRVPGNRDGAFQDIERAVRLARFHATEWGIDPGKLGIIGFSAGGHLSARLSSNSDEAAYPEIDPADKLSCRPDFVILVYPAFLAGNDGKLVPEIKITRIIPPTLIVHTEDDLRYVPGSKLYEGALTAASIPHQFLIYPTGGHGYGLRSARDVKSWPIDAAKWLTTIGVIHAN